MEKEAYSPDREADQTLLGAMLGLWRLEIGPDSEKRLYVNQNMRDLMGLTGTETPEQTIMRCDSDSGKKLIKSMVLRTADRQGMC